MKVVIDSGEYKGNPTVSIRKDTEKQDRYPFSFGLGKANLLLQALIQEPDFLEKFVKETK
ncbi:MAG: hypothetical protein LBV68_09065 [Spirochaetaceae bacterium]|jgi:hypothetical protein|nr:hypothetical protein [Spirochaetaceae bacterium]